MSKPALFWPYPVSPTYETGEIALWRADCLEWLKIADANSVDLVLTDPPYFIDRMDQHWDRAQLATSSSKALTVGGLPVGMKFDPEQGKNLQRFLEPIFKECLRVLKPGGFLISFSQARLMHRMALAAEEAGFEIRDMLGWTYKGQAKAFSQEHLVHKMKITEEEKNSLIKKLAGRKTPQLLPMIEPMVLGQKTKEGTNIENWLKYGVGLIDTSVKYDDQFPGNLMNAAKPSQKEKGVGNDHMTVKPQKVLQHLIKVFTREGSVVLDPFCGSGSTLVAAQATGRVGLGIEKEIEHINIAKTRLM